MIYCQIFFSSTIESDKTQITLDIDLSWNHRKTGYISKTRMCPGRLNIKNTSLKLVQIAKQKTS